MRNLLIGLLLLSGITACQRQDSVADLRLWLASLNEPGGQTRPGSTPLEVERMTAYSAGAERSPFREQTPTLDSAELPAETSALEAVDLEQRKLVNASLDELTLVGTISGVGLANTGSPHSASQALFRDADGRIHRLAAGDRVGREDARLVTVTDTRVEMLEKVPLLEGGWITQTRVFALPGQPVLVP